jgi:hypothetical protein
MAILKESSLQSAHWYTRDGKAMHTVPNADGDGTRPTTLADARKLGLFPSVSAILQVLDKPGLDNWKTEEAIKAAMRLKRHAKESDEYYIERVVIESRKKVKDAGDFGTAVHGEMERYFEAKLARTEFAPNAQTFAHSAPAIEFLEAKQIVPVANEVVLVNHEHGFGGTSDLPCLMAMTKPGVVDYKTKKTEPGKPLIPYPDQAMQIAAYGATYWKEQFASCWGLNLYISSTEPGRTEAAAYSPAQLLAEWEIFKQLCAIWRHLNEYDPRLNLATPPVFYNPKMIVIAGPGGKKVEAPVTKTDEAPAAKPALPTPPSSLPTPPPPAEFPAKGATMLEVIESAVLTQNEADGIKFLSPRDCCAMPPSVKTDYAWWWHAETKTARVSIRNDGAMREHGWHNAFLAYPADAKDIARTENGGKGVKVPVLKPGELGGKGSPAPAEKPKPTPAAPAPKPAKELTPVQQKARIAEIEAMPVTFGKHKGDKKVKCIGDLPLKYLDFLRDCENVPAIMKEYLSFPTIIKRIDKAIK